ncbi:MAG: cache domain-containing protein [Desulfobulbaceae bacterium]|nr:cache domain-containing protein [Desulfobulbaceae bacterium]
MHIIARSDVLKIIAAPLLACILFIVTLFGLVLPVSKDNLLTQKKESIAILTQTAANILRYYNELVQSGELPDETARTMAEQQFRQLRYGSDNKDYFWITDLHPRMIMHPYRPDLEGQDLSGYADLNGKKLFMEFVHKVSQDGNGYVPYLWQWKDLPEQIVPKLSYVMLFEPWGWVIGTGVYLDDLHREFTRTSRKLIFISALILIMIFILSAIIIHQGVKETGKRIFAEQELREHNAHLDELVKHRTADLEEALSKVKLLSGFLPICASCKKIRDDKGYWNQIESYIRQHSEAEFSHSICPDCAEKLYPKFTVKQNRNEK